MQNLSLVAFGLILFAGIAAQGQSMPAQPPYAATPSQSPQSSQPQIDDRPEDPLMSRSREKQEIARNTDRQKKLTEDTEKLLALATELKEQVGKTDKNVLSVDVIKKADEIEKLAKSVKDRMKGSGI
jgi:hypothetical protein